MFCKNCGTELPDGAKFCKKCGTPIKRVKTDDGNNETQSEETSKNSNIGDQRPINEPNQEYDKALKVKKTRKEKKAEKKEKKRAVRKNWSAGKKIIRFILKLILILVLIFVLVFGTVSLLTYLGIVNVSVVEELLDSVGLVTSNDEKNGEINVETFKVEHPDADEYYEQNSKIVSKINVKDSNTVQNEIELCANLTKRGFGDYPISTEYSMDGEYSDATTISETSSEKHPIYQTYYVTAKGDVWTIFVINGSVTANPVSYNMQSELGVQVIISESETVTSYDSVTNKFYETIPEETALIVKVVDKIDDETLEGLTFGAIDGL